MQEKEIEVKDYITKSNLPVSDYVINPYIGCPHACKYCYASFMKRFTNHPEEWGSFIDIKRPTTAINYKKLEGKTVFLSSVTDCYNPYEKKYQLTKSILESLLKNKINCTLNISTKSNLILRDLDLLKQFSHLTVSISINTLDEEFKKDMDQASSIEERIETLRVLHQNGITTILFLSPIFPKITDSIAIIEKTHSFVDEYWFEDLNLRGSYKKEILNYIATHYPELTNLYHDIYSKKDKSYWEELEFQLKKYCQDNKITHHVYFDHKKLVSEKKQRKELK